MDWTLECSGCPRHQDANGLPTVCPDCGSPWLVRYERQVGVGSRAALEKRERGMWRYREFLPLFGDEEPITLGEGTTPLLQARRLGDALRLADLWVKDEAANPTGSFKARGLAAAVTRAVRAGATSFVLPTAGNAGVAAAAYGARAGATVRVYAPRTTPRPLLEQIAAYGAQLELVDGHIGDCGKLAKEYAATTLAMDLSTLREPYRIEGKKTLGLEIAEQLGWRLPGAIIYPTGGGTGLIGMWKAFDEMEQLGWIGRKRPRMVSVQSSGCAPIVKAFKEQKPDSQFWENAETIASGLRVPKAFADHLILDAVYKSNGSAVAVNDEEIVASVYEIAKTEGLFICPEGAASFAALRHLLSEGKIGERDRVVVFNTAAGIKYPEVIKRSGDRIIG